MIIFAPHDPLPEPISTGVSPSDPISTGVSPPSTMASHSDCEYKESAKQYCTPS